ncbi:MAG: hypothetical protein RMJ97_07645 [Raineya sp.]|nr:hypothetical protein [Raineya sp.]MDW8296743.1 hypothetical protein [Raineya sp.]
MPYDLSLKQRLVFFGGVLMFQFCFGWGLAQKKPNPALDTLPPILLMDESLQAELADALDKMYNFEFEIAEKEFLQIRKRYPQHPLPYFLMALSQWWKIMPNTDNQAYDDIFLAYIDTTLAKAEQLYRANPKNVEASFFLAAAYGFKGRFHADREQWFKAASAGRNALRHMRRGKEINELSPEFMFGDGIYNYFAEWIPENYPFLAPIVATFPKGNKELGLKQLDEVARKAFYTRIMANYFLMFIYNGEGKTHLVAPIAKRMYETYPNNPYFHRIHAISSFFMGHSEEAEKLAQEILARIEKKQFGYEAISGRFAAYILAQTHTGKNISKAIEYFEKVIYFAESIKAYDSGYYQTTLEWLYRHYRQKGELEKAREYLEKLARYAEKKNKKRKIARKELRQLKRDIKKQKRIENL